MNPLYISYGTARIQPALELILFMVISVIFAEFIAVTKLFILLNLGLFEYTVPP
jgi:hypothetical protein